MTDGAEFDTAFRALTGHDRFPWQREFYEWLIAGRVPRTCDIPTGLGKTAVIPIWLIALAQSGKDLKCPLVPRRLVYIVNRRTVVDQATDVVQQIRDRLQKPDQPEWAEHERTLRSLCDGLRQLAATDDLPLAISTLRGELADNQAWKADPARPAIIIGTVDMIGSKLLFSGYGDGFRMRPHHAGLIGQDALFVHDEAHLTPAFGELLREIARTQDVAGETRRIRVMELSATAREDGEDICSLTPEDEKDPTVAQRRDASKCLVLSSADEGALVPRLVELAVQYESDCAKVLVYVRQPETASQVVSALRKELGNGSEQRVALLTGTIRGHERDRLVSENPVYRALLAHESHGEQTVYVVSTSAGKVGIDLDADHMVCDLTTLDSMIQRLGRVNRRGRRSARIDVVIETEGGKKKDKASDFDKALERTQRALEQLAKQDNDGYAASPRNVGDLLAAMSEDEKRQAFAPGPTVVLPTDILLDAWSLTSIRDPLPGRPEVAPFLHGLTADLPETYVAWRAEVRLLYRAGVDRQMLRDWFQSCRIEARERLRDRTDRVFKELQKMARRCGDDPTPVVVLKEHGDAELTTLGKLLQKAKEALEYTTVVLPVEAGGLSDEGLLDGNAKKPVPDVADEPGRRERWLLVETDEHRRFERLVAAANTTDTHRTAPEPAEEQEPAIAPETVLEERPRGLVEADRVMLQEPPEWGNEEEKSEYLLLLVAPTRDLAEWEDTAGDTDPPSLEKHTERVVGCAERISDRLGLSGQITDALRLAAKWHDRGKDRRRWQAAISNSEYPAEVKAKPGRQRPNWHLLGRYRHELGSLLEADRDPDIQNHAERDLILHLIAAHHGRARPHFEPDAFDNERFRTDQNEAAAHEVMRRFGRLQQRFGRWGLAWLESLLRCADALACEEREGQRK